MKKFLFSMIMLFCATSVFAQRGFHRPMIDINKCYEVNIDMRRLSDKLQLDENQTVYMEAINNSLHQEINDASSLNGMFKTIEVRKAVHKNMSNIKSVLSEEQFKTYVELFFTTVRNNVISGLRR